MKVTECLPVLEAAVKAKKNVLLISPRGCGKTMSVTDTFNSHYGPGNWKYFSASTLDPYVDLIGVPAPKHVGDEVELKFARPRDISNARALMFDELNRAHHKICNAVLEVTQFGTINGTPLPKLEVVWAACNPVQAGYYTERLDLALEDRFHIKLELEASMNEAYLVRRGYTAPVAKISANWWNNLSPDNKTLCPPRRLEYVLQCWKSGIDGAFCFLKAEAAVPVHALVRDLNSVATAYVDFWSVIADKDNVVRKIDKFQKDKNVSEYMDLCDKVLRGLANCGSIRGKNLSLAVPLVRRMPPDLAKSWVGPNKHKVVAYVGDDDRRWMETL